MWVRLTKTPPVLVHFFRYRHQRNMECKKFPYRYATDIPFVGTDLVCYNLDTNLNSLYAILVI
jgi:hypothetical protein